MSNSKCSICLQNFCTPVNLPCRHIFCQDCIGKNNSSLCPLCRVKYSWWQIKNAKDVLDEKVSGKATSCNNCESKFTIAESCEHNCKEWHIEVSYNVIKCKTCSTYGHWLGRTCVECKQRMTTETEWKYCTAKILLWNNGEPHVMLDNSFCPGWGVGCTASLRLFVLHKGGSMSHFYPLEEDTWRKDYDNQRDLGSSEYEDIWCNWSKWQTLWTEAVPEAKERASIKWRTV